MEYLSMLPGPTNVPNRVMRAMLAPIINHRSDDFVELYTDVSEILGLFIIRDFLNALLH